MKKSITLCGNGGLLKYVLGKLREDSNIEITNIVEQIESLPMEADRFADAVILTVGWREIEKWIAALRKCKVQTIYRVPIYVMQYDLPITSKGNIVFDNIQCFSEEEVDLLYLETHVADTCNLKCRGCMHFSNVATESNFPDINVFERDFRRMKELFHNICIIRLMGGEPLLNPELGRYIELVRQIFSTSEIRIVTNGLLIPYQKKELWKTVRENHVSIDVSPYPPTIEKIDEIKKILDNEGIPYGTISPVLQKFRKSLTLYPVNNPQKAVNICGSSHCRFLRNGKIAKCPLPLLISDFNEKCKCKIESNDYYNIYEEKTGAELKKKLDSFADMCRYCPEEEAFIDWSRTFNDASIEDWIVDK